MLEQKKGNQMAILEYGEWLSVTPHFPFGDFNELRKVFSKQEEDFLRMVIYPMFYREYDYKARNRPPFPLILKDYSEDRPRFVVDLSYFTAVFFSYYDPKSDEWCWEVSFHIKDHNYCDERVKEFKSWYNRRYSMTFAEMNEMPEEFLYPKLNVFEEEVKDFCIEFWGPGRDCQLFKLLDLFSIH